MPRPLKDGLDYFPLDCSNDDKLDLIEAKYNLQGWAIVVKLWQQIYKENGYWYKWTEKEQLLFKRRVNVDINLLNDVINDCLRYELFNQPLFKKYEILTSNGIQKRFLKSVDRRKNRELIAEYCLFDVYEYKNSLSDDINLKITNIGTQSKVKESKGKESKGKNIYGEFKNVKLSDKEHQELINSFGEESTSQKIESLSSYMASKGKKYKSHYATILTWHRKDKNNGGNKNGKSEGFTERKYRGSDLNKIPWAQDS